MIEPRWPGAVPPGVAAVMSTRRGGASAAPFDSLNLGTAVGDAPASVATNRAVFGAHLAARGGRAVWLRQVHGVAVLRLVAGMPEHPDAPADAAWTTERGLACTVGVADCLPVLLAAHDGRAVAAAHAGWRGLAAGVLERTVESMCAGSGVEPTQLLAWLGPCIGPDAFEVGSEVLEGFGRQPQAADQPAFRFAPRADGSRRWRADLHALARERLHAAGLRDIAALPRCTVGEPSDFFSYRRDGRTGRMAAAVWRC